MARATSGMDMNGQIAALLRDFAAIQKSKQSMWGYKRAASGDPGARRADRVASCSPTARCGRSRTSVLPRRASSWRCCRPARRPTVERAIAESGQAGDIEQRRDLRDQFLSRAQVLAALTNRKLTGPRLEDYRGDLQMHSTWSDGSQTLEDIVEAGIARGYAFCAVTDHSYGLKIAGGVSMAELARAAREIDVLNRKHRGTIPAAQGDRGEHPRRRLGRHGAGRAARSSRSSSPRRTRCCGRRAIRRRGWSARSDAGRPHPRPPARAQDTDRGPGVTADWDRGLRGRAAQPNVAIEIDGDPSRQDSITTSRGAPSTPAASSRSTATRTPRRAARTRRPRSRTPASPASPPIASSIAGRLDKLLAVAARRSRLNRTLTAAHTRLVARLQPDL